MGGAHSLPDRLDEETTKRVAGAYYDSNDFESLSAATPGYITREQLMEAAAKRGMSFSLRTKSTAKFDFGAEAKGGGDDDDDAKRDGAKRDAK